MKTNRIHPTKHDNFSIDNRRRVPDKLTVKYFIYLSTHKCQPEFIVSRCRRKGMKDRWRRVLRYYVIIVRDTHLLHIFTHTRSLYYILTHVKTYT